MMRTAYKDRDRGANRGDAHSAASVLSVIALVIACSIAMAACGGGSTNRERIGRDTIEVSCGDDRYQRMPYLLEADANLDLILKNSPEGESYTYDLAAPFIYYIETSASPQLVRYDARRGLVDRRADIGAMTTLFGRRADCSDDEYGCVVYALHPLPGGVALALYRRDIFIESDFTSNRFDLHRFDSSLNLVRSDTGISGAAIMYAATAIAGTLRDTSIVVVSEGVYRIMGDSLFLARSDMGTYLFTNATSDTICTVDAETSAGEKGIVRSVFINDSYRFTISDPRNDLVPAGYADGVAYFSCYLREGGDTNVSAALPPARGGNALDTAGLEFGTGERTMVYGVDLRDRSVRSLQISGHADPIDFIGRGIVCRVRAKAGIRGRLLFLRFR